MQASNLPGLGGKSCGIPLWISRLLRSDADGVVGADLVCFDCGVEGACAESTRACPAADRRRSFFSFNFPSSLNLLFDGVGGDATEGVSLSVLVDLTEGESFLLRGEGVMGSCEETNVRKTAAIASLLCASKMPDVGHVKSAGVRWSRSAVVNQQTVLLMLGFE